MRLSALAAALLLFANGLPLRDLLTLHDHAGGDRPHVHLAGDEHAAHAHPPADRAPRPRSALVERWLRHAHRHGAPHAHGHALDHAHPHGGEAAQAHAGGARRGSDDRRAPSLRAAAAGASLRWHAEQPLQRAAVVPAAAIAAALPGFAAATGVARRPGRSPAADARSRAPPGSPVSLHLPSV